MPLLAVPQLSALNRSVAVPAVRAIRGGAKGAGLIPVLGATGKVQLVTGLLAALGIAISG